MFGRFPVAILEAESFWCIYKDENLVHIYTLRVWRATWRVCRTGQVFQSSGTGTSRTHPPGSPPVIRKKGVFRFFEFSKITQVPTWQNHLSRSLLAMSLSLFWSKQHKPAYTFILFLTSSMSWNKVAKRQPWKWQPTSNVTENCQSAHEQLKNNWKRWSFVTKCNLVSV